MSPSREDNKIDQKKWEAATRYVRAAGRLKRLLKEKGGATNGDIDEANEEYDKALKHFNRVRLNK